MTADEERLRERPSFRFQGPVVHSNLDEEIERLQEEEMGDHHQEQGHRQVELYRDGGTTVSLFQFEEGGALPPHQVPDGSVSFQVLEGTLKVAAEQNTHSLQAGEILFLDPATEHAVTAAGPSVLLLTIMRGSGSDE